MQLRSLLSFPGKRIAYSSRHWAGRTACAQLVHCDYCSEMVIEERISDVWGMTLKTDQALRLASSLKASSSLHPHLTPQSQFPTWVIARLMTPSHLLQGVGRGQSPIPSPSSEVYEKGTSSATLPPNSAGALSAPLDTPCDIVLHGGVKITAHWRNGRALTFSHWSLPPFWIQISAAPVCSESPLNFLCGAIPW